MTQKNLEFLLIIRTKLKLQKPMRMKIKIKDFGDLMHKKITKRICFTNKRILMILIVLKNLAKCYLKKTLNLLFPQKRETRIWKVYKKQKALHR